MKRDRECDRLAARADEIFCDFQQGIYRRTDRLSAMLLAVEWLVLVAIALCRSPYTWDGAQASIHPHVLMAIGIGGIVCGLPALVAWRWQGQTATR
jgi:hypothetical protein